MNARNVVALAVASALCAAPVSGGMLPNGFTVTPAGAITQLGTLPLHIAVDPSGRWLAVTNSGYSTQGVTIVDAQTGTIADSKTLAIAFYGVAFAPDGRTLYASTAGRSGVERFGFDPTSGHLADLGAWQLSSKNLWISGIAISPDGRTLYATAELTDSLIAIDTADGATRWSVPAGSGPYAVVPSADGIRLFVSDWTGSAVSVISAADGKLLATIAVDAHPNALLLSSGGSTLYVACANSDTVDVVDTASMTRSRSLDASLWSGAPEGTTPNGLALGADGKTLFVADADENAVVAIDVNAPNGGSFGAIPVGWYPTDVALSSDGRTVFVLDGKGVSGHANPGFQLSSDAQYVGTLATGDLERISVPDHAGLVSGLQIARQNSPYSRRANGAKSVAPPPIRHVIYIIKENRTYDQVLGDDPRGNGDAKLAMFGRRITPNFHHLADDFALLDNFETDSEVSADGHNWTDAAFATDYVQKLWPSDYSGRNRDYDFEDTTAARPPAGYLWDHVLDSVRVYGEQMRSSPVPVKPQDPELVGHYDPLYPSWDLKTSDQTRVAEWLREFRAFAANGKLPKLEVLWMPDDHTAATRPGYRTPFAMVASNDFAVGRIVDALSHSRYWKDTVVFVVEDDAQAGPDHVSDERSVALVAGGSVRRGIVDHTHYTQSSVLRTIEMLLKIAPMSQFDASATPMTGLLTSHVDLRPWTVSKPNVNINQMNPAHAVDGHVSSTFDFSQPDRANAAAFNKVLMDYARSERNQTR